MLTKDDIAALRSAAEKATPGPWKFGRIHPPPNVRRRTPPGGWPVGPYSEKDDQVCADASYIALLSPDRILALCYAADALRDIVQFCDEPNGSRGGETLAAGMARLLPRARAIVGDK